MNVQYSATPSGFLTGIFMGKSVVMQIFIVMLIFLLPWAKILGGMEKVLEIFQG